MKRQSKAEEALKRQIKQIDAEMDKLQAGVNTMQDRISGMRYIREQLDNEVGRLEKQRLTASETRKP